MSYDISILMPGIRVDRWENLYASIQGSTKRSFELIICGPVCPPSSLLDLSNVKFIKDLGSSVRASNLAALLIEGKYVTWTADDATFFENSLDENIDKFEDMGNDIKNTLICRYGEGGSHNFPDSMYYINTTPQISSPFFKDDWMIFNIAIMHTSYFLELGAWDCIYETCPIAHLDFAVRAQEDGAICKLSEGNLFHCTHMPGRSGDHAPIHDAQLGHDEPLFRERFRDSNWREKINSRIDINNWKKAPKIWSRRFGNG